MSLIDKYRDDLRKYRNLKNKIYSIVMELSLANDNVENFSYEMKSKYLVNDSGTPIVSRSEQLKSNLVTIYSTLNNKILPAIDSNISSLNAAIIRLENEQKEKEQEIQ